MIKNTMMKQSKGLKTDLNPEQKKITNTTTMDPTTAIDIDSSSFWNR